MTIIPFNSPRTTKKAVLAQLERELAKPGLSPESRECLVELKRQVQAWKESTSH
ncbi:hypothetical protein ACVFYP_07495 [Roseomonas sp. F4]